jgi:hypothetical protein
VPEFPDIAFSFRSFACSGARVDKGITGAYAGAEKDDGTVADAGIEPKVPPQMQQANDYLATLPAATRRIDALVMNIGGNNLGFAEVIKRCTNLPPHAFNPCSPPSANPDGSGNDHTERVVTHGEGIDGETPETSGLDDLPGIYADLDRRIDRTATSGLRLSTVPRKVFMTGVPNPLAGGFDGCGSLTGQYDYENRLQPEERNWVNASVFPALIGAYQTAAVTHGWQFVPLAPAVATGMCAATNRMVNRNRDALPIQGATIASTAGIGVSHGWVHPNAAGYEAMAPLLANQMRTWVVQRFTPAAAPSATGGPVPVKPLLPRVEMEVAQVADDFPTRPNGEFAGPPSAQGTGAVGAARVEVPTPTTAVDSAPVRTRRCGPVGFSSPGVARGCGAQRIFNGVLTGTPVAPASVTTARDPLGVRVTWTKGSTATLRRFLIEATEEFRFTPGGPVEPTQQLANTESPGVTGSGPLPRPNDLTSDERRRTITREFAFGPTVRAAVLPVAKGADLSIVVRECTDRGCSGAKAGPRVTAGGTLGAELQRDLVQQQMVSFPVGVFAMRTGIDARVDRTFPLIVSWGTWRNWRDLRELRLELHGRDGRLATLRYALRTGRVTLGRRTRRAGRRGTLAAGPVSLQLRGTRLRPGGPASRLVAARLPLRFARALRGQRIDVRIGAVTRTGRTQRPSHAGSFRVRAG